MILLDCYRRIRTKRSFKKGAKLGKNIKFGCSGCLCQNGSGNPENISIGDESYIMGYFQTQKDGRIKTGHHFYIGPNSFIGAIESITIGDCVIISNDVKIYDNNNHPTSPEARMNMSLNGYSNDNWKWHHSDSAPVVIEDNVWIGQYVTILKGVTIGKGSIIGTKAVVTKDVPPYTIVAGNPAKVVKKIDRE